MPPRKIPLTVEYENEYALERARVDLLQRKWEILDKEKTNRGWKLIILPPVKR